MNENKSNSDLIPRLLRIQDVARYLSATTWFVEELIRNRKIRFLIVGKRHVVDVNDLNDWIDAQKKEPLDARVLTDQEAKAFFAGIKKDEDGNYEVRIREDDE
jgi:excisionase family DNA binding protein